MHQRISLCINSRPSEKRFSWACRVAAKLPITTRQVAPGAGAISEYGLLEIELLLDNDYFCHIREVKDIGLDPGHIFDAYDADNAGERIQVDAVFRHLKAEGGAELQTKVFRVPGFAMRDKPGGPWQWKVRFAPPAAGRWEMKPRAVVWHRGNCREKNYDETRVHPGERIEGHNRLFKGWQAHYHYWGYADGDEDEPGKAVLWPADVKGSPNHHAKDFEASMEPARVEFRVQPNEAALRPLRKPDPTKDENPMYLYRDTLREKAAKAGQRATQPAGKAGDPRFEARPVFLAGASMAWTCRDWNEYLAGLNPEQRTFIKNADEETKSELRASICGFNSLWFAPWETMLVHGKGRGSKGEWEEEWDQKWDGKGVGFTPGGRLRNDENWQPWSYYDQGRAAWMDNILEMHRQHKVYYSLCIWPHAALSTKRHPWEQIYWRNEYDQGIRVEQPQRTWNGLAALRRGTELKLEDKDGTHTIIYFLGGDANPKFWLWQKNLYRYIVARYGWDPFLVFWGAVAEVEGVGGERIDRPEQIWWWTKRSGLTRTWLAEVVKTIRELEARPRPITAWAMNWNKRRDNPYSDLEQAPEEDHGALGYRGYEDRQGKMRYLDLWAFDAYPTVWSRKPMPPGVEMWSNNDNYLLWVETPSRAVLRKYREDLFRGIPLIGGDEHYAIWRYFAARPVNWVRNVENLLRRVGNAVSVREKATTDGPPRLYLLTEFGATETAVFPRRLRGPVDPNNRLCMQARTVRSYIHYALWSAFAAGHCGTPLRWFDNAYMHLAFEELTPLSVVFRELSKHRQEKLLAQLTIRDVNLAAPDQAGVSRCGLRSPAGDLALVWVFQDQWSVPGMQRTYEQSQATYFEQQVRFITLVGMARNKLFKLTAYNTWTGQIEEEAWGQNVLGRQGVRKIDKESISIASGADGRLLIPVGRFAELPKTARTGWGQGLEEKEEDRKKDQNQPTCEVWDGADILYLIEGM